MGVLPDSVNAVKACVDGDVGGSFVEIGRNQPILFRHEGVDLVFAVDDEAEGDGLDPSGRLCAGDFVAYERAQPESDEAVKNSTGLLCFDELLIDAARIVEGVLDGVAGDFVEHDPARFVWRDVEDLAEMPRNGFAFAVRVGCEVDAFGAFGGRFELVHDLAPVGDDAVLRLEIVFYIDA